MRKIIAYGIGDEYNISREQIYSFFEVWGVSDYNANKGADLDNFVMLEDLAGRTEEILVVSRDYISEMVHELIKNGVSSERLIIWQEEQKKRQFLSNYENGTFYSLSQFGEDYVVSTILKSTKGTFANSNYVEIGVCNPYIESNTYFLHLTGGKGILVDADPRGTEVIKVARRDQVVLNKAVTEKTGESVSFYLSEIPAYSSMLPHNITDCNHGVIKEEIEIETISINDVLGMMNDIDFLSIDVEGYDVKLLKSIDYQQYHPLIICAETGLPDKALIDFMESIAGYKLTFCNRVNTIWTRMSEI